MNPCKSLLAEVSKRMKDHPPCQRLSEYNIFRILGVHTKEVVMCRFLADLLNPEGAHGMGPLFLRTFLPDVLQACPMSAVMLAHTEVVTEFLIDNDRRIDIVIRNAQYVIPIEVKIDAPEQKGQCYDYYRYARNAPIVYLTRFGNAPSEYSRKQRDGLDMLPLNCVRCISWSGDIARWLASLLPKLGGPVELLVRQYLDTIYTIADEQGDKLIEQSVQAVLTSPEFFQAGLELERSMNQAKVTLMRRMFDCFKEEMETIAPKYGLKPVTDTDYYTYEHPAHDAFYNTNSSTWPALNYVVEQAKFQASGLQLWFRIEVDHQLFAGFSLFDAEMEPKFGYSKGCQVDNITPELMEELSQYLDPTMTLAAPSDWWLTYCYPNGKCQEGNYCDVPNFKTMNQCAIDLVDPQKRQKYVRKAIQVFETMLLAHLR